MHSRDIAAALDDLRATLAREEIPFAVIGALAMRQHGYARHTEAIDIVTTPDGFRRIHERLVGRGLSPRGPGLRKKLRNTVHKVDMDVLTSGELAGGPGSPACYPHPLDEDFATGQDSIRYATLPALITFKIASGVWGRRPRDLADAQELIKVNGLGEEFVARIPEPLQARFLELLRAVGDERDIE